MAKHCENTSNSSKVSIGRPFHILNTLEIFALDKTLYTFLDHVEIWTESTGELCDDFSEELLMGKLFALSIQNSSARP